MPIVTGTFNVTMKPEPPTIDDDSVTIARATFDKVFEGPLTATSQVEFVSVRAGDDAAYVAIERIVGSIEGRVGSFVVTHVAGAHADGQSLRIAIVPGAGRGDLAGIRGAMTIEVVDGVHRYSLDYAIEAIG